MASNNDEMAKQIFIHTRLSRAYLALARLSCIITHPESWASFFPVPHGVEGWVDLETYVICVAGGCTRRIINTVRYIESILCQKATCCRGLWPSGRSVFQSTGTEMSSLQATSNASFRSSLHSESYCQRSRDVRYTVLILIDSSRLSRSNKKASYR